MKGRIPMVTLPVLATLLHFVSCAPERERLVEAGRWADESMPALFIVYYMDEDIAESELQKIQKPIARQFASEYSFITQVTVHDENWAAKLTTKEMRRRIIDNELPIGSDLVLNEGMTVRGGLVYTYYRNGDYDEFIYHEKDEGNR